LHVLLALLFFRYLLVLDLLPGFGFVFVVVSLLGLVAVSSERFGEAIDGGDASSL
jgi:hypothetical protein